ncbi:exodeoxyribonuclease VII large subunit [Gracilibacillus caseinilyticus]|uniref:Exodeoxyribonuclease 7 large subunit n=1 Tax=Gracilibacillus caseinilyticus TaxID=2932256 RepID=A0ABY4ETF5_9BACI|nr:exodeoxyribonuclease VII large subunit [Gracilibacillus caseinilyticus]UOQ47488.1 exodeoxyribonuclease VII large subunit [Gracilibacillus caseinilyticus]
MEDKYLSVTALTKYIKKKFDVDQHLNHILLRGEISNYKHHSRGHMYLTIKDEQTSIRAVMFQRQNQTLKFRPEDGMKVLITGYVSVFESQGQYQLYIQEMEPDGIGALYLAFEQLKEKLAQEGLFDPAYKKELPTYPKKIAVLTSPTGAAIRDILTTLERRYPIASVLIIPVLVQGKQAAASIVSAIEQANELNDLDVIILGRGGGSLEELWSFNEEVVARAIFHSTLPVISAVGHETDITISDMVADLRAATPTAAAELAVPTQAELLERIHKIDQGMESIVHHQIRHLNEKLQRLQGSYVFKYPGRLVEEKEQRLDRAVERLSNQLVTIYQTKKDQYTYLEKRYARIPLQRNMNQRHQSILEIQKRMDRVIAQQIDQKKNQFTKHLTQLDLLNPTRIMSRGYSITYNENNDILRSVQQIDPEDELHIQLTDGIVKSKVQQIRKDE